MPKYDLYKTETGLLVAVDEKGNMVYGTTAIDLSKKQKPKQMDYSQITNLANKRKTSSTKKTEQVNIGTENAPLMVPKGSPAYKQWLASKSETEGDGEETEGDGEETEDIDIPEELANDPYFQQLDDESKKLMSYYWNIMETENKEKQQAFEDALDLAEEQANPYWKEQIRIFKDEVQRSIGSLESDLEERAETLSRRKKEIQEDLIYNKEYLSTSEQSELARQARKYDQELETVRSKMAERGLSFSSIRGKAEERLAEEKEDMVESIEREYGKKERDIKVEAERKTKEIQDALKTLERTGGEKKEEVARKAEQYLGTEKLKSEIPGMGEYLMGDIEGTLQTEKAKDVLERTKGLFLTNYPSI